MGKRASAGAPGGKRGRTRLRRRLAIGAVVMALLLIAAAVVAPRAASAYLSGRTFAMSGSLDHLLVHVDDVQLHWTGPQQAKAVRVENTRTGETVIDGSVHATTSLFTLLAGGKAIGIVTLRGEAHLEADDSGVPDVFRGGAAESSGEDKKTSTPWRAVSAYRGAVRLDGVKATYRSPAVDSRLGAPVGVTGLTGEVALDAGGVTVDLSGAPIGGGSVSLRSAGFIGSASPTITRARLALDLAPDRFNAIAGDWLAPGQANEEFTRLRASIDSAPENNRAWIVDARLNVDTALDEAETTASWPESRPARSLDWLDDGLAAAEPTRALFKIRVDSTGVQVLERSGAALRAGPALLEAAGLRRDDLSVDAPATALVDIRSFSAPWRDAADWRRGVDPTQFAIEATARTPQVDGTARLTDAPDARLWRAENVSLEIISDALAEQFSAKGDGVVTLDDKPAGSFFLDAAVREVLRTDGALNPTPRFEGRAELRGVASDLLQPFVAGSSIRLSEDLGPTVDLIVTGASAEENTEIDVDINATRLSLQASGLIKPDEVAARGDGLHMRLEQPDGLLDRLWQGGRVEGARDAAFAELRFEQFSIPLQQARPDLRRAVFSGSAEIGRLRVETLPNSAAADRGDGAASMEIISASLVASREAASPLTWTLNGEARSEGRSVTIRGDGNARPAWTERGDFDPARTLVQGQIDLDGLPTRLIAASARPADRSLIIQALGGPARVSAEVDSAIDGGAQRWSSSFNVRSDRLELELDAWTDAWRSAHVERLNARAVVTPGLATTLATRSTPQPDALPKLANAVAMTLEASPFDVRLEGAASTPLDRVGEGTASISLDRPLSLQGVAVGGDERIDVALRNGAADVQFGGGSPISVQATAAVHDPAAGTLVADASARAMFAAPFRGEATLSDIDTDALEGLIGRPDLITPLTGSPAKATVSLQPQEDTGDEDRLLRISMSAPRLVTSARIHVLDDRLAAAEPFVLDATLTESWLNGLLTGPEGGDVEASVVGSTDVRLEVSEFSVGRGDSSLASDVFALRSQITSPALRLRVSDGGVYRYEQIEATVRNGETTGEIRFGGALENAQGESLRLDGRVERLADAAGRMTREQAAMSLQVDGALPETLIDALLDAGGRFAEAAGPGGTITLSVDSLGAAQGGLSGRITSDRIVASLEAEVTDGVLRATQPVRIELRRITPQLGDMVFQRLLPLLGRIEKKPEDGPAFVDATSLSIPTDGDLRRLSGRMTVSFGRVRYQPSPFFGRLLAMTDNDPGTDLFRRWAPVEARIDSGRLTYERFAMPIGELDAESEGSVDLVNGRVDIITYVPLTSLIGEVRQLAGRIPGVGELTKIPLRTTGEFGSLKTEPALDLLAEESIRRPGKILEDVFDGIFKRRRRQ